jgi:hypothetical protein
MSRINHVVQRFRNAWSRCKADTPHSLTLCSRDYNLYPTSPPSAHKAALSNIIFRITSYKAISSSLHWYSMSCLGLQLSLVPYLRHLHEEVTLQLKSRPTGRLLKPQYPGVLELVPSVDAMNDFDAYRMKWKFPQLAVNQVRRALLSGLILSWSVVLLVILDGSIVPDSHSHSWKFRSTTSPTEWRRIRVVFGILLALHTSLLVGLVKFCFSSGQPLERLSVAFKFGLAGALMLALAIGIHLGMSKGQATSISPRPGTLSIYRASAFFAVDLLVQGFLIYFESWWLPHPVGSPLHNEPTVQKKSRRDGEYGTIRSNLEEFVHVIEDDGYLERLFLQQSSSRASARPIQKVTLSNISMRIQSQRISRNRVED